MALQMMAAAWSTMRRAIIANCFKHAGFAEAPPTSSTGPAEDLAEDDEPSAAITAAWAALEEIGKVPANVQLGEYVDVDSCVAVHEEVSDEQIIKNIRQDEDSSADDTAQDAPTPAATSKVMDAFDIIRGFIGAHDDDVAMALLAECEDRITPLLAVKRKQSKLTDFWQ